MRLRELLDDRFRIEGPQGALGLCELERLADERVVPEAPVVEVPAADPAEALAWLEAAWRAGALPVPSARARTASALAVTADLAGVVLGVRTAGSTGAPRIAAFSPAALSTSCRRIAACLSFSPQDRLALLQPLEHGFGLIGQLLAAGAAGATVVPCARAFADERARAVQEARPTIVAAVPFLLSSLLDGLRGPLEGVRQVGSAGARLPPVLVDRLAAAFPDAVLWNQYGCTEAGPRLCALASTDPAFAAGSVGRPLPGVELELDAEGGIVFASDMAMAGYLGDPAATDARRVVLGSGAEGWRSGDRGALVDGRLSLHGRDDDLVKVRGERVSLEEVARAAERAGARAAAALMLQHGDDVEGRLVLAYEGESDLLPAAVASFLRASAKPRRLVRLLALPRLSSGKLDRLALAEALREAP